MMKRNIVLFIAVLSLCLFCGHQVSNGQAQVKATPRQPEGSGSGHNGAQPLGYATSVGLEVNGTATEWHGWQNHISG